MNKLSKIIALSLSFALAPQVSAITIQLDYRYDSLGFFEADARRSALQTAANYFTSRISDNLTPINSGAGGVFNATFFNPATGFSETIHNFSVAEDTLIVFAGGRPMSGLTIGEGGSGGFTVNSATRSFINNAFSRGQGNATEAAVSGAAAYDFASWGGSIAFDSDESWYFDNDVATIESFSDNDFYSVALHELAHLLGFGASDSWDAKINGENQFTGSYSVNEFGGYIDLYSSGAHWQEDTLSLVDAVEQEAAMDPTITEGSRKYFTRLDWAGLQDVGWEVKAVPVPPAIYLFMSALVGVGAMRREGMPR